MNLNLIKPDIPKHIVTAVDKIIDLVKAMFRPHSPVCYAHRHLKYQEGLLRISMTINIRAIQGYSGLFRVIQGYSGLFRVIMVPVLL